MNFIQALVLGVVQGLTEFLPISSSGHLVLFPYLMGWNINHEANIPYDIIVHFGTLIAVLAFFYGDVKLLTSAFIESVTERKIGDDPYRRLAWFIIIGTIPTGIVYLLVKDMLQASLENPVRVGIEVIITGLLLVASEFLSKRISKRNATKKRRMNWFDVVLIGIAQGVAILPGISRSGATIATGLFRGLTREEAARFSFLLSIPVILAVSLEQIGELAVSGMAGNQVAILFAGFVTSTITGYLAIKYFIDYLKKHSLYVFAFYCFALGTITLIVPTLK